MDFATLNNPDDGCYHVASTISDYEWKHLDEKRINVFEPGKPSALNVSKKQERKDLEKDKKLKNDMNYQDEDKKRKKNIEKKQRENKIKFSENDYNLSPLNDDDLLKIVVMLDQHRCIPFCQSALAGTESKNVWIVKPAGKSRGRGE